MFRMCMARIHHADPADLERCKPRGPVRGPNKSYAAGAHVLFICGPRGCGCSQRAEHTIRRPDREPTAHGCMEHKASWAGSSAGSLEPSLKKDWIFHFFLERKRPISLFFGR